MMTRVLLVDDDMELSAMLREYLQREGLETTAVPDGVQGVEEALSGRYDIVVLDVMLPQLSGVEALRRIRTRSRVPVLMLTAKGDDVDRIVGLELGATTTCRSPARRASSSPGCARSCGAPREEAPSVRLGRWPLARSSSGPSSVVQNGMVVPSS